MAENYIVNPNGEQILIGYDAYRGCYIESAEYSDEYQGESVLNMTILADKIIPIQIGARCNSQETRGDGGYILLSPPSIERKSNTFFIYKLTFSGFVSLLETTLLFNQDIKGWGWNLDFALVGTPADFLGLVCRNMNRTIPAQGNYEIWSVGAVGSTDERLISFSEDNCLTALKKVSEAYNLPYKITKTGGFHECNITVGLTSVCRVHDHVYTILDGISKISIQGDSDRGFATALFALGGSKNIPFDYRGGSEKLQLAGVASEPIDITILNDWGSPGEWNASLVTNMQIMDWSYMGLVYNGSTSLHIYPDAVGDTIMNEHFRMIKNTPIDVTGGTLSFWYAFVPLEAWYEKCAFQVEIGDSLELKSIVIRKGMYGMVSTGLEQWHKITIPIVAFGLNNNLIDRVGIKMSGIWVPDAGVCIDYIKLEASVQTDFIPFKYDENEIAAHGRIESVVTNDNIYPKSNLSVTEVFTATSFEDLSMFDLNAKDGDGNTIYMFDGVTPNVTFTSGNLSGYSFAIKKYTHSTHTIELIPTEEFQGTFIPSENEAYIIQIGDTYVLTEINPPQQYITNAEAELASWADEVYPEMVANNEIADIEIDHVWLKDQSQQLTFHTSDNTSFDNFLEIYWDLFETGDLVTISAGTVYTRELRVLNVAHDKINNKWNVKLGNNTRINFAGRVLSKLKDATQKLSILDKKLKMQKYNPK